MLIDKQRNVIAPQGALWMVRLNYPRGMAYTHYSFQPDRDLAVSEGTIEAAKIFQRYPSSVTVMDLTQKGNNDEQR